MPELMWEVAVIGPTDARCASVAWRSERRLPSELILLARQMGYSEAELSNYAIGELTTDLTIGDETFLRGAIVVPDEDGLPATLFGCPLLRK